MKLPTQGASKAEIVFRIREMEEMLYEYHMTGKEPANAQGMNLITQLHILSNILKDRFDVDYMSIPKAERESLVIEYVFQLESETNDI
jgi:hypothetical protein